MSYTCNHIGSIIYDQSYMGSYTVYVIHPHPTTLISLKLKDVGKYFTLYELKKKVPPPPPTTQSLTQLFVKPIKDPETRPVSS